MTRENLLSNIVQKIGVDDDVALEVKNQLKDVKKIHSFIAYGKYTKNGDFKYWEIHYNVSQSSRFNTITIQDVVDKLSEDLPKHLNGECVAVHSFKQPNLTLLLKQYKPLIFKLSKELHGKWEFLEMEDLMQMCSFVICELYYKNYYVHKALIRRSFANYVLMHIRKNKNRPVICSLEQMYHKSDDDSNVTIADMVPDTKLLDEQDDKENEEVMTQIITEVKDIIIDLIGPRQYDQLLREYANKQTTPWSRKLMYTIKAKLFDMGITIKSFNKYYG